jgi:hypothetical protein
MTTYFQNDAGGWGTTEAQLAVDRVRDALTAGAALWPSAFVMDVSGDVQVISDTNGELNAAFSVTPRHLIGTSLTSQYLPAPTGILVKWITSAFVAGRHLTGKTFLVPMGAHGAENLLPLASTRALAQAFGDAMLNAGLQSINPVVWSRPFKGATTPKVRPAREGSSAPIVSVQTGSQFTVLTSRRD